MCCMKERGIAYIDPKLSHIFPSFVKTIFDKIVKLFVKYRLIALPCRWCRNLGAATAFTALFTRSQTEKAGPPKVPPREVFGGKWRQVPGTAYNLLQWDNKRQSLHNH